MGLAWGVLDIEAFGGQKVIAWGYFGLLRFRSFAHLECVKSMREAGSHVSGCEPDCEPR